MSGCFGAKSRACKTFFCFIMIQISRRFVPVGKTIRANGVGPFSVGYIEAEDRQVASIQVWQYELVYNAFSFTIAVMALATVFSFFGRSQVAPVCRTALTLTGLVTFIALYHYVRIFNSWHASFTVVSGQIKETGIKFNDAYRYVDWLLTVLLLLIELILVMRFPGETTAKIDQARIACRTNGGAWLSGRNFRRQQYALALVGFSYATVFSERL
jgi:bacteriorhodopsin